MRITPATLKNIENKIKSAQIKSKFAEESAREKVETPVLKILDEKAPHLIETLSPTKRDIFNEILTATVYKFAQQIGHYASYCARRMLERGLECDYSVNLERTDNGAICTIEFNIKKINPKLLLVNRRYFTKHAADVWTKWVFTHIAAELAATELDEIIYEIIHNKKLSDEESSETCESSVCHACQTTLESPQPQDSSHEASSSSRRSESPPPDQRQ